MLSIYDLSVEERDGLLSGLTDEQRLFVNETMVRGRKTCFARILAARKGAHIPEDATYEEIEKLVDDWAYLRYEDAGVVTDALKCDCGRSLRYAHTVKNLKTGETHTFGITHLELHTGIDAKVVAQIKLGFDAIDFELNELLYKLQAGWSLVNAVGRIPEGLELPEDIRRHLELGLPLLDRQLLRLKRLIAQHNAYRPLRRPRPDIRQASAEQPATPPKEESYQAAFDLFGDGLQLELPLEEPAAQAGNTPSAMPSGGSAAGAGNAALPAGSPLHLEERLRQPVLTALRQGMQSARMICELLIQSHGADDSRYSTGKPAIYTAVCAFLDMQVEEGTVRLLERDQNDRLYKGDPAAL